MITFILSITLAYYSFWFYSEGKFAFMFFFLTLIASDFSGFGLLLGESPVKITDITILVVFFIWLRDCIRDKYFFSLTNDRLGKVLFRLFIYLSLLFVGTILFNQDSVVNAFKVYRIFLIIPLYFILKKMSINEYEKYIRLMLIVSCIQGVFYYLQFIGITGILSGYGANSTEANPRLGNYPFMAGFFFLYFLFSKNISGKNKLFFIVFFGLMPILGQMRGQTMMLALSACIFFYYQRKRKYFLYVIIGIVAWGLIVKPMFNKRADEGGISTTEEISMLTNNPLGLYNSYVIDGQKGSFVFRLAMLAERVNFMIENPKFALTGVGCVNELSPKNTYTMLIGTDLGEELSETSISRPAYLGSADIVWVGILMRYGIIGVILLMSYYILIFILTHKNIHNCSNPVYLVYACSAIPNIFATFDGNTFESVLSLIVMCGISAFITTYNKQKSLSYDSYTH